MIKKKLSIIMLMLILIFSLTIPVVRAENETATNTEETNNSDIALINDTSETRAVETNSDLKEGDVTLLDSGDVNIDYDIDGNLFVIADTITITSKIGGDAFIIAKDINISNTGMIYGNLFSLSENCKVEGLLYDIYSISDTLDISGYILRDVRTINNSLNITGLINRNVFASCSKITFPSENSADTSNENETNTTNEISDSATTDTTKNNAHIGGNLNYSSSEESTIPNGFVSGSVNFEQKSEKEATTNISEIIISLGSFVVTAILIWLIIKRILPKFTENCDKILIKKPLQTLGYGILTPIIFVVCFVILLLLNLTIKFALISFTIFCIMLAISSSIFAIATNNIVCEKLKITKTSSKFGILVGVSIILYLIALLPYIGSLFSLLYSIFGLGIAIYALFSKNKTFDKKDIKEKEKEN